MEGLATLKTENSISFKTLESGKTEVSFMVDRLSTKDKNAIRSALEQAGEALTIKISKYRKKEALMQTATSGHWLESLR